MANERPTARQKWLRRYGLSEDQYAEMVSAQGGLCAICKTSSGGPNGRSLAVDHCHDTGVIRGALCWNCNSAIGHLRDDPALALAAYGYLMQDRTEARWGVAPPQRHQLPKPVATLRRLTEQERQAIRDLHAAGMSYRAIAVEVGRSDDTIWRVLRKK